MLVLVSNKIKERSEELQRYRGWIPFQFASYINLPERHNFLKSIGLEEEVQAENERVMQGYRDAYPYDDVYLERLLKKWLRDNPQFRDLVIIKK